LSGDRKKAQNRAPGGSAHQGGFPIINTAINSKICHRDAKGREEKFGLKATKLLENGIKIREDNGG
jgi:hypothetical protein